MLARSAFAFCALLATSLPVTAQGCPTATWQLTAGQTIDVGSVSVTNDNVNIYVTYTLDYQDPGCIDGTVDAVFGTLHLWIGDDLLNLPLAGNGQPIPGQFPYHFDATGLTTYTFTVAFADLGIQGVQFASDICNMTLYVVPHAEVQLLNCDGTNGDQETAFGGNNPNDPGTPRWYFYGDYTVCCAGGPPGVPFCQTAYAKGGWVWTTQRRSNPEQLPSLNLTRNRWGWAINLTATGMTTYDIWAGAGLNDTGNGTLVGTLTLVWDGTSVQFFYDMNAGYSIEELHVYAGDDPVATIAPGQYGYTQYFDPPVSSYGDVLPLADDNGGGVWVVAHAVVCSSSTAVGGVTLGN